MNTTGETSTHRHDWWPGCSMWESADVLARHLSEEPERVYGRRVLELGAGCALSGLAAGALGARQVLLTDEVVCMAAHNLEANFGELPELSRRFKVQKLRWGDQAQIAASEPPYDVILGSDLLYESDQLEVLADTLVGLSSPGTSIFLATPDRVRTDEFSPLGRFYRRLQRCGIAIEDIWTQHPNAKKTAKLFTHKRFLERGTINIIELLHS